MSSLNNEERATPVIKYDFYEAIKDKYFFKLNAYHSIFGTLILMQMIALGLSFFGQSVGVGTNDVFVQIKVYTADVIISFTYIWAFMMAMMLTNRASKNMMSTFVTDKRTNHLANFLFMITLSVIGGVTSFLLGFFVKMLILVIYDGEKQMYFEAMTLGELFIGIIATILYILLVAAIGYVIGEAVQMHHSFKFFVPVFIVGIIIVFMEKVADVFAFYAFESNFIMFICKVVLTVAILFTFALWLGRRLEVRKA